MKKLFSLGAVAGFLFPLVALAQSNLDGTWKVDVSAAQIHDRKPVVILFQDGVVKQDSSFPGMEIKADGQYYPLSKEASRIQPEADMVALKIVDARHLEINEQKNGRVVTTVRVELSADGNTTTETFSDSSASTTRKEIFERVAPTPPGSEPFSGSWRLVKLESISDNGITITFKTEGDIVHLTDSGGYSCTANLDGTDAPFYGNPSVTTASFKRTGPNTYELTEKAGDKVVAVVRYTVSADGKTMNDEVHVLRTDLTIKYLAVKQ